MNPYPTDVSTRQAAIHVLAVIGFIALVGAGMWLAVYSTRFVPSVVNRIGAAAVYLGSVFTPATDPSLSVVPTPTASTTISFGDASSTVATTASSASSTAATKPVQTNWTPGTPIAIANGTNSSPAPVNYHGLPDLTVQIDTVGYTVADGSIVSTTTIPAYKQGAVKFRVTNIGTNVSGSWAVNISVSGNIYTQTVDSLVPTEPRGFIAYFANVAPGVDRAVIITIDPNHQLSESSTANNSATTSVTILGN